jgi:hypothetical protein
VARSKSRAGSGKRHVSKSKPERLNYLSHIQNQRSVGTIEDPFCFEHTDSLNENSSSGTKVTSTVESFGPTTVEEELGATTNVEEPKPRFVKERQLEWYWVLGHHIAEQWPQYLIAFILFAGAIIVGITGWAVKDVQIDLSKLGIRMDFMKESVQKLDKKMDETEKKLKDHEMAYNKNEWNIAAIQKLVDNIRTELDNMRKSLFEKEDRSKPSKATK